MSVENCESSASQLNSSLKKKKKTISNYNKKQLLIMLKESNCRPKQMGAMTSRFRVDADVIKSVLLFVVCSFCFNLTSSDPCL